MIEPEQEAASTPNPPRAPTGYQPTSMNRAVMNPQAMKAPMFGITMFDRNVPNF
jgi:hypothetical protein